MPKCRENRSLRHVLAGFGNRLGKNIRRSDFHDVGLVFFEGDLDVGVFPQKSVLPVSGKTKCLRVFNNQRIGNFFGESPSIVLHKDEQRIGLVLVKLHALQMIAADAAARGTPEIIVIDDDQAAHYFSFMR